MFPFPFKLNVIKYPGNIADSGKNNRNSHFTFLKSMTSKEQEDSVKGEPTPLK